MDAAENDELGVGSCCGFLGELEGVARDVGEPDDLVTLVVVPEDEHPISERRLRCSSARDEVGVACGRQIARALDASLARRVRAPAEQHEVHRSHDAILALGVLRSSRSARR